MKNVAENQLTVTIFPGAKVTTPDDVESFDSWDAFVGALPELLAIERYAKDDMPYLGPYTLKPGSTRADANIDRLFLVVLDLDVPYEAALIRAAALGLAVFMYETPTSTPETPKARLMFPVTRPMLPSECGHVRAALAEVIGLEPGCGVEACLNPHIGFFVGQLTGTPPRDWLASPGAPVDVDALVSRKLVHDWSKSKSTGKTPRALTAVPSGNVEPEHTPRVAELTAAMVDRWLAGNREDGNFEKSFYGWLLGKGWKRGEVVALVNTLDEREPDKSKRDEHARKAQKAPRLSGRANVVREWFGEGAGTVDEIVNRNRREMNAKQFQRTAANDTDETNGDKFKSPGEEIASEGDEANDTFESVDRTIKNLAEQNVYQRSGRLVRVTREAIADKLIIRPGGAQTIQSMPLVRLGEIIATMITPDMLGAAKAEFDAALEAETDDDKRAKIAASEGDRERKAREAARKAGNWQAQIILERGEWSHIRPLEAIVTYPVMRADGSILNTSGYDHATRTLANMNMLVEVPEAPTQDDARAALALLVDVICDFPFRAPEHRSAWVAFLLTIVARPAVDGSVPFFVFDANTPGAGKGKLVSSATCIASGADATARVVPKNREEWDKTIFSVVTAGDPVVLWDNVKTMIDSDAFESVLTTGEYAQRVLGITGDRKVRVRNVFAATCNNCTLSTDLVRRSVYAYIEAGERPEERDDFKHKDLKAHVLGNRQALLSAALTIVRAYKCADRPPVGTKPLGSFEEWAHVVRDAIVWAGGADCVTTQAELRENADISREQRLDLFQAWHAVFVDKPVTVRDVIAKTSGLVSDTKRANLEDALRGIMPHGVDLKPNSLGTQLRKHRRKTEGGMTLVEDPKDRDGTRRWHVVKI